MLVDAERLGHAGYEHEASVTIALPELRWVWVFECGSSVGDYQAGGKGGREGGEGRGGRDEQREWSLD